MMETLPLDLTAQDLSIVREIPATHVPARAVFVFGSRASGKARRRSDLDLAVGGSAPLTLLERALLNEAFDDSDLPITVDLVDICTIAPDFLRRIERDFVSTQPSATLQEAGTR